ncbi:MAG TPA: cytochrome b/b6 domain-containing protein [Anaerolineales bacterium]|nr:cytochrome b/b6 domain-containing protein [Anaerolineales bacterium]
MSATTNQTTNQRVSILRTFQRFTIGQRWEHMLILLSFTVLLLTGLPQKYRLATWSQQLLSTPGRLQLVQQIHHIAAIALTLEVIYHLANAIFLLARRNLSGDMLPTLKDVKDAWQMLRYLLFLTDKKPAFGKYNFEQKFTYWFMFFAVGIMVVTGFVIWFPELFSRLFPGGIIPAAKMAHSTEAIVTAIFILIWHFYHVHIERLNLSIFTGWLNENDMLTYHELEYQHLTGEFGENTEQGEDQ